MFETVSDLTNEWLNSAGRSDRLMLEKEVMGVVTVIHPLANAGDCHWYVVQLQEGDRLCSVYFMVDRRLEDYEEVKLMLLDTAIGYLLEFHWYVVNFWEVCPHHD